MRTGLLKDSVLKYVSGIILIGVLLFLPAGDIHWKNGWLLMAVLFIPMFFAGTLMYIKAPDLLRSRLKAKETQSDQKDVIRYSGVMFLATFILAGLNYRFQWTTMPETIVWIGVAVFLLAYSMFGEVLRENQYLSRVIEVQANQTVVDTGLYGIVRHPMYSATVSEVQNPSVYLVKNAGCGAVCYKRNTQIRLSERFCGIATGDRYGS